MRWLRLLGSVTVVVIGILVVYVGLGAMYQVWIHHYPDDNVPRAIPFMLPFVVMAAGGAFVLRFGVRLFRRNLSASR